MSKQPIPPPPGDKPVSTAPPSPPSWRHWLWPIAILAMLLLYVYPHVLNTSGTVSLNYSTFLTDAGNHQVKTAVFGNSSSGSNTTVSGVLKKSNSQDLWIKIF